MATAGTSKPIVFDGVVQSVRTLVDGGLRVTFDLPEDAIEQVKLLMECKRDGTALRVAVAVNDGKN